MTGTGRPADRRSADSTSGTVRTTYDWSSTTPSTGVIETIAVASDRKPTDIEPLYDTLDPDALDTLIRSSRNDSVGEGTSVRFEFAGHDVTVQSDGTVSVRPV